MNGYVHQNEACSEFLSFILDIIPSYHNWPSTISWSRCKRRFFEICRSGFSKYN